MNTKLKVINLSTLPQDQLKNETDFSYSPLKINRQTSLAADR